MSYPEKQAWQALKSRRKTLKDEVMLVSKEIILKKSYSKEATKEEREPVMNGEKS